MSNMNYETGKAPHIHILTARGDVSVRAWQESRTAVSGNAEVEEVEGGLRMTAKGSLSIRLPEAAALTIDQASGDMSLRGLQGDLQLGDFSGDLVIKNAGRVSLRKVSGDLVLVNLNGDATIDEVSGDASMRRVLGVRIGAIHGDLSARFVDGAVEIGQGHGDINLNTVSDDLSIDRSQRDVNLRNLGGVCRVESAHGDIRLRGGLMTGKHSFKADGDIVLRWPANAPLSLTARAPSILNRLPLEDPVSEEGLLTGHIGDGAAVVNLEAGGRIVLKAAEPDSEQDWDNMGAEFASFGDEMAGFGAEMAGLGERLAGQLESQMAQISVRLESKFGPDFAQRMAEKAARRAEQAVERVARHAEKSRRHAGRHGDWSPPPPPPKQKGGVSAEEQRKVLEMLEKGLISVDEANALLKAMGS